MASIRRRTYKGQGKTSISWEVRWMNRDGSSSSRSFRSQKEARSYAHHVESSEYLPISRVRQIRLPFLWDRVVARRRARNQKNSTISVVAQAWDRIAKSSLVEVPISRIDAGWVQDFVNESRESVARKNLAVLRELHREAVLMGFDGLDWTSGVKVKIDPPRRKQFLDSVKVMELAKLLPSERDSNSVLILAFTGMRVGELAALRVADWDSERRRIHVLQSASFVGGKAEISTTKTKNSERVIPVPSYIADILDNAAVDQEPDTFLWRSSQGKIWRAHNFRKRSGWRQACEAIGFPNLRIHDLRHSYASIVRRSGQADLPTLSKVMGHSSIKVTIDLYGGLFNEDYDDLARGLDDLIGQKMGETAS